MMMSGETKKTYNVDEIDDDLTVQQLLHQLGLDRVDPNTVQCTGVVPCGNSELLLVDGEEVLHLSRDEYFSYN